MSLESFSELTPGLFVLNKMNEDWELRQIQSSIGNLVRVNLENAGKKIINTEKTTLETIKA